MTTQSTSAQLTRVWEGNLDGDMTISILDLSAMGANYGRSVTSDCQIE